MNAPRFERTHGPSGIAAGFNGGHWDRWWLWLSLGLLIAILGAMSPMGSGYYAKVRHAVAMNAYSDPKDAAPPEPASTEALDALLKSLGKKLDKPRVSLLKAELEAHADKTHSPRFWAKEVA